MTVLEQGVRELMQKLEETCTEMQQGAENHICEVCRFCTEEEDPPSVMPIRRALQISLVLEDALGGDSRGASGMMIIIRCRGGAKW
ncbi:hypothetical protein CY35_19G083900 [Sphagnum magellanicum]|nr:hypothetical protein CY35_19G083900 [Sphagnum magellanicum]